MADQPAPAGFANAAGGGSPDQTRHGAWWVLALLIAATLSVLVTRDVLTLVIDDLKRDLQVTDFQISLALGLWPAIVAIIAGLSLSWLADKGDRGRLLTGCILFGAAATALTGLAQNFWQLTAASAAIAIGQSVLGPLIYSIIPDLFAGRARDLANQAYYGTIVVGGGVGMMLSGAVIALIASHQADLPLALATQSTWRTVLFAVALPGVALGAASLLIRVGRATALAAPGVRPIGLAGFVRAHWPSLGKIYVGVGLYTLALGAVNLWLPIAIVRATGTSAAAAGVNLGLAQTIGAGLGVLAAMASVRYWQRRFPVVYPSRVMALAFALAIVPVLALPLVTSPTHAYLLSLLYVFFGVTGAAYSPSLFQSMAPAHLRARAIAIGGMVVACVAMLGPVAVGALSDGADPAGRELLFSLAAIAVPALALAAVLIRSSERGIRALVDELDAAPAARV